MADYLSWTRSNVFKVTDKEKFIDVINNLESDGIIEFHEHDGDKEGETKAQFMLDGTPFGYETENGDFEFIPVIEDIQMLLPDGEVCVIIEAGHEKLRYVDASVLVITNETYFSKGLVEYAQEKSREMLRNNDYVLDI